MAWMEEAEFHAAPYGYYAVVPPGSTLTTTSPYGVHLYVEVSSRDTTENVTALGIVDAVNGLIDPAGADMQSIEDCANWVGRSTQLSAWQPDSPNFWQQVAGIPTCYDALNKVADAASTDEDSVIQIAEKFTTDFFESILPKLGSLVTEHIFG